MSALFAAVLRRELLLAWQERGELAVSLAFFLVVALLFPFALPAGSTALRELAPGVIWVSALLASLLATPRLFAQDHASGALEQLLLSPEPAEVWIAAKVLAHALASFAPLLAASPLLALLYHLSGAEALLLAASLLLGAPLLCWLNALGAALTLGLPGAAALLSLLVLPLCVPALIFGAGMLHAWNGGQSITPGLALLAAASLASSALAPFACARALRLAPDAGSG